MFGYATDLRSNTQVLILASDAINVIYNSVCVCVCAGERRVHNGVLQVPACPSSPAGAAHHTVPGAEGKEEPLD